MVGTMERFNDKETPLPSYRQLNSSVYNYKKLENKTKNYIDHKNTDISKIINDQIQS